MVLNPVPFHKCKESPIEDPFYGKGVNDECQIKLLVEYNRIINRKPTILNPFCQYPITLILQKPVTCIANYNLTTTKEVVS